MRALPAPGVEGARGDRSWQLWVAGLAAPQGSKKIVPTRQGPRLIEDNDARKRVWRTAVEISARATYLAHPGTLPLTGGPVGVAIVFYLPRPASAPRYRRWQYRKPDPDKLARSTLDGLAGALFGDDAQVADLHVRKVLAENPADIGAAIRVVDLAPYELARRSLSRRAQWLPYDLPAWSPMFVADALAASEDVRNTRAGERWGQQ